MEKKDVHKKLRQAFKQYTWHIKMPSGEVFQPYEHFADLYNCVEREIAFWTGIQENPLNAIISLWNQVKEILDQALADPAQSTDLLKPAHVALSSGNWPLVMSNSRLGVFINAEHAKKNPAFWHSFRSSFDDTYQVNLRDAMSIEGFVVGQVFRSGAVFVEHSGDLIERIDDELGRIVEKGISNENEHSRLIGEIQEKNEKEGNRLEKEYTSRASEIEKWISVTKNDFDTSNEERKETFKNLVDLYEKKLQLEAPANYWSKRAENLRNWGIGWGILSILTMIVGGLVLWHYYINFDFTPEHLEKAAAVSKIESVDIKSMLVAYFASIKNLKSVTAFAVIVSAFLFLLRTFIKLTLSAFHLSIDAREREQLTFVYLALVQKGQKENVELIKDREREIILQSLFSRAESGLLKGDSGPTMPGDLGGLIGKLGKG
jgi:hypothetical protein